MQNGPILTPDFESGARFSAGLVALASTLAVVADLSRRRRDRLRGIDPTTIEPRVTAKGLLREASEEISIRFLDLAPLPEAATMESTRPMDALKTVLALRHIASSVSVMHQRLLSLYPEVEPGLIERARSLRSELSDFVAGEIQLDEEILADLASRGIGFALDVDQAISPKTP